MKATDIKAPEGTSGLACEPFCPGEVYAVAANWAQASAPVWFYGESGWNTRQYQVADFRHSARAALLLELAEAIEAGGDDPEDTDLDGLVDEADEI